jgi:hypothetical protein
MLHGSTATDLNFIPLLMNLGETGKCPSPVKHRILSLVYLPVRDIVHKYPNMVLYIIRLPSTIATENATLINAAIHTEVSVPRTCLVCGREW